jgi:hypothetical protein
MPGGGTTKALQSGSGWFEVLSDFPQHRQTDVPDFEKRQCFEMWRLAQENIPLAAL